MTEVSTLPIPLATLEVGRSARFHEAALDEEARDLLRALGLTNNALVRVCQQSEPCIVQVRSTRIGLSKAVAGAIMVVPQIEGHGGA